MSKMSTKQVNNNTLNNTDVLTVQKEKSIFYLIFKRISDIFLSIVGIIITSPVFVIISVISLIEDPKAPIFFKQKRIGKGGALFHIYKFRSMVTDAEERLKSNKELYEKYIRNNYKLEPHEDPRITTLGRFLRKTSLDELPQLLNVLKGDMSLIGPRPVVEEELKEYGYRTSDFTSVKPGLTGYWQVSGRSDVGYPERVDIELYYVYNQSLSLDVKIFIKTILIVITKKGAY